MLNKVWAYLAGLAGILLAALATWLSGRRSGKATVEKQQLERSLEEAKQANEIDDEVRGLSDAALDKRLRKHQRD